MNRTSRGQGPQDIRELLALSSAELQERSADISILLPEEAVREKQVLDALLGQPPTAAHWLERCWLAISNGFSAMTAQPFSMVASAAMFLGLVWVGHALWEPGLPIPSPKQLALHQQPHHPQLWSAKGGSVPARTTGAGLHIGIWNEKAQRLQRLASGARCQPSQHIVFGFSMAQPGGYVYLFLSQVTKKPRLLYPFTSDSAVYWKAKPALQLLRQRGTLQQYQLRQHRGRVYFSFLQSARPLTARQIRKMLRHPQSPRQFLAQLQTLRAGKGVMALHTFNIKVEAKP